MFKKKVPALAILKKVKGKKVKTTKVKTPKEKKVKATKEKKVKTKKVKATKEKKAKTKVAKATRTNKGTKGVSFLQSIRFKLIMAVFVPVICIIALGIISYNQAKSAIVSSYTESTTQTVDMLSQYIGLIAVIETNEFRSYVYDTELAMYVNQKMDTSDSQLYLADMISILSSNITLDSNLKNVFFITNDGLSITQTNYTFEENAFDLYSVSTQAQNVFSDANSWHLYGVDTEADDTLGIDSSTYGLRIARHLTTSGNCVIMINLSAVSIRETMQSLDPGEGGYVILSTSDGKEFYSDDTIETDEPIFYGTDSYEAIMASEEVLGNDTITINGTEYLMAYGKITDYEDAVIVALVPSSVVSSQANAIKNVTIAVTVVAVIIALALGLIISGQISSTIRYIITQLKRVSAGDLTIRLQSKNRDELGELCVGVNDTVDHMKDLIVHVNEVSSQVTHSADDVASASDAFVQTVNDIQDAVEKINAGVNKLDSGSDNCMNQMDDLSGRIGTVSENASEISRLTASTGTTIGNGIAYVQGLTASAESTTQITENVISAINELEEKSKSINNVVKAINEIAEQTNLLSLNASIEAARAGEAGRGFSVVAEEIRKLSDQCLVSANQISAIVSEIIGQTKDVASVARQAQDVVNTQVDAVEDTTRSFQQIDEQVKSLLGALNTIINNVQDMNGARSNTLEAIEGITAVSAETASCSDLVSSTANTQMDAVDNLTMASDTLRQKADSLTEALQSFTV